MDAASALRGLDASLPDDWESQVARAYSVFGIDPLDGADELGLFNLPELDPDFLRAKAKEQLRDAAGKWRKMRARIDLPGTGRSKDRDAPDARTGRPLQSAFGSDWPRSVDGRAVIPQDFVDEATDPTYGPHSLAAHMGDSVDAAGNPVKVLSRERERLYDELYTKSVDGVPKVEGRKPRSWSLGGGAGAGKSTVTRSGILPGFPKTRELHDHGKKPPGEAVLIEADGFKLQLPEFEEYPVGQAAGVTHVESTLIAKTVLERSQSEGYDTVLDGMGDSKATKLQAKADSARSKGVESVDGVYVSVPTEEAMARVITRAFETGRIVEPDRVVAAHASVSQILEEARSNPKIFDHFDLYDSSEHGSPRQIVKDREILDQKTYEEILGKTGVELLPALEAALEKLKTPGRYFGERVVEDVPGQERVLWSADEVRALSIQYATDAIRKEKRRLERAAKRKAAKAS
jgi:hypothetical protein